MVTGTETELATFRMSALPSNRASDKYRSILLLLLVLASMGRICTNEFAGWDNPSNISRNPDFDPPTLKGIAGYWLKPTQGMYIPLPYTIWGLLAYVARVEQPDLSGSRINPWVYHSANLAVHALTSLLVLATLRRMGLRAWAAWMGAAVFAVHPLQVETVAWASGLRDLLCTLF